MDNPAEEKTLKDLWKKFEKGDSLSDDELEDLIISASVGLNYLKARNEKFVSFKTQLDLDTLKRIKRWREEPFEK